MHINAKTQRKKDAGLMVYDEDKITVHEKLNFSQISFIKICDRLKIKNIEN